jgi:hypothetical protein
MSGPGSHLLQGDDFRVHFFDRLYLPAKGIDSAGNVPGREFDGHLSPLCSLFKDEYQKE